MHLWNRTIILTITISAPLLSHTDRRFGSETIGDNTMKSMKYFGILVILLLLCTCLVAAAGADKQLERTFDDDNTFSGGQAGDFGSYELGEVIRDANHFTDNYTSTDSNEKVHPLETMEGSGIDARIPTELLDIIDKQTKNYHDNTWGISEDQLKVMITALAWAEGHIHGYAAHSSDSNDKWHKDLPNEFHFSAGLGPWQWTMRWDPNDDTVTTIKKLNSNEALRETLFRHKYWKQAKYAKDLDELNSIMSEQYFAYTRSDPDGWNARWKSVTGTEWNDVKGSNKSTDFLIDHSDVTWETIKTELIKNEKNNPWIPENEVVKDIGKQYWKVDGVTDSHNKAISINEELPTWIIKASKAPNFQYEYYYTYCDTRKIEIWAYKNEGHTNDRRSIFIRTYNKNESNHHPDNNGVTLNGPAVTISDSPTELTVNTRPATDVGLNQATLNGGLTSMGGVSSIDVCFEWGTDSTYGSKTDCQTISSTGNFAHTISGLSPGTTYHYRAVAVGVPYAPVYGTDQSFTTDPDPSPTPKLHTDPATDITETTATLHGRLQDGVPGETYDVCFRYEGGAIEKTKDGYTTVSTTNPGYQHTLTGLEPGTTYYYRAVHQDSQGVGDTEKNPIDADKVENFTTLGGQQPGGRYKVDWNAAAANGWFNPLGNKELWTHPNFNFDSRIYEENYKRRHAGVDFVSDTIGHEATGWSVHAIADGKVVEVDKKGTDNEHVFIRHDSRDGQFFAVYGHINTAGKGLEVDSTVDKGQVIGIIRETSYNPDHLHFGINDKEEINDFKINTTHNWGQTGESNPQTFGWHDPIPYLKNNECKCKETPSSTNVDIALVIDSSGSMAWNDPINMRLDAAKLFIDLADPEDQIAIIDFAGSATIQQSLIKVGGNIQALKGAVNRIGASGGTNIGGGLRAGYNELDGVAAKPEHNKAALLLTDGEHGSGTHPSLVVPDYTAKGWPIHSIGFTTEAEPQLLKDISANTGGRYYHSPSDEDLQGIFIEIYNAVRGLFVVETTRGTINQDDTIERPLNIDPSILYFNLVLNWGGSDLDLDLFYPDGGQVVKNTASLTGTDDPDITYISEATYEMYKVQNPQQGDWKYAITGVDVPQPDYDYTISLSADTTIRLNAHTDKLDYNVGEDVPITAEVTDGNVGITDAQVTATITLPDQSKETLVLPHTNNGVYSAFFSNTIQEGYYSVLVDAKKGVITREHRIEFDIKAGLIPPPSAQFTADRYTGSAPLSVRFNDTSTGSPTSWLWNFGDGTTSSEQHPPIHTFTEVGTYTVTLRSTNTGGSTTFTDSIIVTDSQLSTPSTDGSGGSDTAVMSNVRAGSGNTLTYTGLPIQTIEFTSDGDLRVAVITVDTIRFLPAAINPPNNEVYRYFEITPNPNTLPHIKDGVINFHMPVGYLTAMGLTPSDVMMMRYMNGIWEKLPTALVRIEDNMAFYRAETPAFSTFAIVFEKGGAVITIPEPTQPSAAIDMEDERKTVAEDQHIPPTATVQPDKPSITSVPTTPAPKQSSLIYAPFCLIIIGLLFGVWRRGE